MRLYTKPRRQSQELARDVALLLDLLAASPLGIARQGLSMLLATSDRRMRLSVEEARRRGELVIWRDGAYRLAQSEQEYRAWRLRAVLSRIGTLRDELLAMDETARRRFGVAEQLAIAI